MAHKFAMWVVGPQRARRWAIEVLFWFHHNGRFDGSPANCRASAFLPQDGKVER